MKKEYDHVTLSLPPQSREAVQKPASAACEPDGTPRSIALMATMMYEIAVSAYGVDAESFRYSYLQFSDGTYGLRFYADENNPAPSYDPYHDHYRRQSAMLRDMEALSGGSRGIAIDPENLEINFTRKVDLLDVLCELVTDEENMLSNPESVDIAGRIGELLAPMELPDDRHSKLEALSVIAQKFDSYMAENTEVSGLATLTFLPRAFNSLSEYKASLATVLDADMTSCFGHILKTIQQEERVDTRGHKSEMNYGGYN